jgi:tRNA (cmo5U34)-methyltransferase
MAQFHFDPETYAEVMQREVPEYERLQREVAAVAAGGLVRSVLELGTGTGETARRVLHEHPEAHLVGIDASPEMLAAAREALSEREVDLRVARLEDPLPDGPFDLVVSALAVHHLAGRAKADLFARVFHLLRPGGRFVLADVVVPEDPDDAVTPLDQGYDVPSRTDEQLQWLGDAGFLAHVAWEHGDLAVLWAERPG